MVSPLKRSRRELVSMIPGISSMMLPMLIFSTESPRPHWTARKDSRPPKPEQSRAARKPLSSSHLSPASAHLSSTPMMAEAMASRQEPPKNGVKEAETRAQMAS